MELMFQKEDLSKCFQMLQGVASGRNTLPILSNILIRAGNGKIEMAATDLEVGIKVNVPGERSEERRVGKECTSRWSPSHQKKKNSV